MVAKVCERSISTEKSVVPRTIQNCILFGYTGRSTRADAIGKVVKKVVIEDVRNAPEQVNVDVLFSEYLINIGACTAQLSSEPSDGTSLLMESALNELSGMNHNSYCLCVALTPGG